MKKETIMARSRTCGLVVLVVVVFMANSVALTDLLAWADGTRNLIAGSRLEGAKLMAAGTKMIYAGWKMLNKGLDMRKQSEMSSDIVKLKEGGSKIVDGAKTLKSDKNSKAAAEMMSSGRGMMEDARRALMKLQDKLESTKIILEGAAMILQGERMVEQGREMLMANNSGQGLIVTPDIRLLSGITQSGPSIEMFEDCTSIPGGI